MPQKKNYSVIDSESICIRRFQDKDLPYVKKMMQSQEVMRHTGFKKPQSEEQIHKHFNDWKNRINSPFGVWAIEESTNKICVGWIMLKYTEFHQPEVGFMISRNEWNKGYATKALKLMLNYATKTLELTTVIARVNKDNMSSINVLMKSEMNQISKDSFNNDNLYFEFKTF